MGTFRGVNAGAIARRCRRQVSPSLTSRPLPTIGPRTRRPSGSRTKSSACVIMMCRIASGEVARTRCRPKTRRFTTGSSRQRGGNALKAFRRNAHTICMPPIRSDAMGGMGGTTTAAWLGSSRQESGPSCAVSCNRGRIVIGLRTGQLPVSWEAIGNPPHCASSHAAFPLRGVKPHSAEMTPVRITLPGVNPPSFGLLRRPAWYNHVLVGRCELRHSGIWQTCRLRKCGGKTNDD
jgi:hypothetical protein